MPKIAYVETPTLRGNTRTRIAQANGILEELAAQGYSITLRQLYYQFVARGLIENNFRSYQNLGETISNARLWGMLDWNLLEDRTRNLRGVSHWGSPADVIASAASSFRLDKWRNQAHRVEVWVEKDALVGIVERATSALDLDYFSCRGYVSQSEMWAAAERHRRYEAHDQSVTVLHLGDHDPSGLQMTEDIERRLDLFGASTTVRRIALNMDQVEAYQPPPNPTKLTDSRAGKYVEEYGNSSWELDALSPAVLDQLIRDEVEPYRDEEAYAKVEAKESKHRATLSAISGEWKVVEDYAADGFPDVAAIRSKLEEAERAVRDEVVWRKEAEDRASAAQHEAANLAEALAEAHAERKPEPDETLSTLADLAESTADTTRAKALRLAILKAAGRA